MTSPTDAPSVSLQGNQQPRLWSAPDALSSTGKEAVELAALAGLILDPWQEFVLDHSLGERAGGKWAAKEVGLNVSRQNGKGSILEARELAGLFLLNETLIVHSAHLFSTSQKHFSRIRMLIENTPELSKRLRVKPRGISYARGDEGIFLHGGQGLEFRARTKGGGRGFTADLIVFDECMDLPDEVMAALIPTLSTVPNPQVWYTGSAVDQEVHPNGVQFARIRERGIKGDPDLAYFEWSVDESEFAVHPDLADDLGAWAQANPALGIRIAPEYITWERRTLKPTRKFATERLGVGDWPSTSEVSDQAINHEAWKQCIDLKSKRSGVPVFAVDATPNSGFASIAVAAEREDGLWHIEVVEHRPGLEWVVDRCRDLVEKHDGTLVVSQSSPVAQLLPQFRDLGSRLREVGDQEYVRSCGYFYDLVDARRLRHRCQPELEAAVSVAQPKPVGDGLWKWRRKDVNVPVCPLVACTLAVWAAQEDSAPEVWSVAEAVERLRGQQVDEFAGIDEPLEV